MEFAALFLSIIKAVPAFRDIFVKAIDLYYEQINAADTSNMSRIAKKRDALVSALKLPGLEDEKRNEIRRMLYDIARS